MKTEEELLADAMKRGSKEARLTNAMGAMLGADPHVASEFAGVVLEAAGVHADIPAHLDVRAEAPFMSAKRYRADLLLTNEDRSWALAVEVKLGAPLHEGQLDRYLDAAPAAFLPPLAQDAEIFVVVLSNRALSLPKGPRFIGSLTWHEVLGRLLALDFIDTGRGTAWRELLERYRRRGCFGTQRHAHLPARVALDCVAGSMVRTLDAELNRLEGRDLSVALVPQGKQTAGSGRSKHATLRMALVDVGDPFGEVLVALDYRQKCPRIDVDVRTTDFSFATSFVVHKHIDRLRSDVRQAMGQVVHALAQESGTSPAARHVSTCRR